MCNKLGIDTNDVLDAACSKWNFLNFRPGLVGGHCIGVDPYYMIRKSQELGYTPQLLTGARKINEGISEFIVDNVVKKLLEKNVKLEEAKVQVLGITFKENVNDTRNSKVINIIKGLQNHKIKVYVKDSYVSKEQIEKEYKMKIEENTNNEKVDVLLVAVAHDEYKNLTYQQIDKMLNENKILFDIKNIFDREKLKSMGIDYWRL